MTLVGVPDTVGPSSEKVRKDPDDMARIQTPQPHGNGYRIREPGTRQWVRFPTKQDAQDYLDRALKAARRKERRDRMTAGAGPTLAEIWERREAIRKVSPKTKANQASSWRKWVEPQLGPQRVRQLTDTDLIDWLTWMEDEGASPYTQHAAFMVVSGCLTFAMPQDLTRNVATGLADDYIELPNTQARGCTWEEVQLVAKAVPAHYRLLFIFMAVTGLRASEACGLDVRGLHLEGRAPYVHVFQTRAHSGKGVRSRTKGGGGRDVPIPLDLVDELRQHIAGRDPLAPVFVTADKGVRLHYANLRNDVWAPAVEATGLDAGDPLTMHDLRHYACTFWLDSLIPPHSVQKWMGHKSLKTTLKYAHTSDAAADLARSLKRGA
jgi:integrase